jgi:hypothetical protein
MLVHFAIRGFAIVAERPRIPADATRGVPVGPSIALWIRLASAALWLTSVLTAGAHAECTGVVLDPPISFHTGPNAHFMVARDFNGDGLVDLAVTNGDLSAGSLNSSLAVMIRTGNRNFAPPVLYTVGRGARGVVACDLNGDGITDLAVSNLFSSTVSVLLGQGTGGVGNGTFSSAVNYAVGSGPFELVCGDFTHDGIPDLATCLNQAPGISVLPGVGAGAFSSPVNIPLSILSTGLAIGDLNGDGLPDLIATQNGGGKIAVLLGTAASQSGPRLFQGAAYFHAGPQPFHVVVTDFNGDGKQDLAVANTTGGGVSVMLGVGDGTFAAPKTLPSGNSSTVGVADLNHDGILDIVTGTITGSNAGDLEVFNGQGSAGVWDGTFGDARHYATNGDVYQLITSDIDYDGAVDVVTAQGYGDFIALLFGTCTPIPLDPEAPVITSVQDVPRDNGGEVFVTWTASSLDASGGAVNSYRVWRRIPPTELALLQLAQLSNREVIGIPQPGASNLIVYWEALATLPAQRLPSYGYTAATTRDSLPSGNPYTAFFVSALTPNIDVFYSSSADSGYSVDNLPPESPAGLAGGMTASGFSLHWDPDPAPDVNGYRLYRGANAAFVPSAANLIAAPSTTAWVDPSGHGEWNYKLSAVDKHGNESSFALLESSTLLGIGPATAILGLVGARPNPSPGGKLGLAFSLAQGPVARLEVLDLSGRLIFVRDLAGWGPGDHALTIGDDKPLASGIYFVRLTQAARRLEKKAVVAR